MRNQFDALAAIGSKSKIAPTSVGAKRVKHDRELLEQAALVEWANLTTMAGYRIGEYLVHVPNEGKRGPKASGDFKKSGGKKGYPDLILDIAASGYHGLRIEMKAIGGKPTPEQLAWIERLRGAGYHAEICVGFDAAKAVIESYLS